MYTCKKINSFDIWMYQKILKISYTSNTTNEMVLKRVNEKGLSLEKNIEMRNTQHFGHTFHEWATTIGELKIFSCPELNLQANAE